MMAALAAGLLAWLPPVAAQEHGGAPAATAEATGSHGEAGGKAGGHGEEEVSELAVEHGSIFRPIARAINVTFFGRLKVFTGPILNAWFIAAVLMLAAWYGTRRIREGDPEALDPRGLQNVLELIVEGFTRFSETIIGPQGPKYVPLIATFFVFILLNNYCALIPGFVSPTATLNLTLALALTAFCSVQYFAITQNGLGGYLYHFAGSPKDIIGWALAPLMFVLELLGECVKPLSLGMRLFGNIFGEDTVIAQLSLLALSLGGWHIVHGHLEQAGAWWAAFVPIQFPMMLFALFGGLVQALVFTMLTSIYISLLTSHEHEGHEAHGHEEDPEAHHG